MNFASIHNQVILAHLSGSLQLDFYIFNHSRSPSGVGQVLLPAPELQIPSGLGLHPLLDPAQEFEAMPWKCLKAVCSWTAGSSRKVSASIPTLPVNHQFPLPQLNNVLPVSWIFNTDSSRKGSRWLRIHHLSGQQLMSASHSKHFVFSSNSIRRLAGTLRAKLRRVTACAPVTALSTRAHLRLNRDLGAVYWFTGKQILFTLKL